MKPNLQNIPIRSETGRRIRRAFLPNRPGDVFLSADYSQIELRLLAHICGDETLVRTLRDGEDIHTTVAARIHGKDPTEVTREERSAAKAVNFGVIYGMGAFGLARDLRIPLGEAFDVVAADVHAAVGDADLLLEASVGGVVLEEIRQVVGGHEVVDGDDVEPPPPHRGPGEEATNATEPVDAHSNAHAMCLLARG